MRKLIIGFILGALVVLVVQYIRARVQASRASQEIAMADVATHDIEERLAGAKVMDVSWSPSTTAVTFAYDRLYDVHVTYERAGRIKEFTTQYGVSGSVWISQPASVLEILDNQAKVIHERQPQEQGITIR